MQGDVAAWLNDPKNAPVFNPENPKPTTLPYQKTYGPHERMGWVWKVDLPPKHKTVLAAIAHHADKRTLKAFPSVRLLAEETGYSERTVKSITRDLRERGYLKVTYGYRKSATYQIQMRGKPEGQKPDLEGQDSHPEGQKSRLEGQTVAPQQVLSEQDILEQREKRRNICRKRIVAERKGDFNKVLAAKEELREFDKRTLPLLRRMG